MKSRKIIPGKPGQNVNLKLVKNDITANAPALESYIGLPRGAKFPSAFPNKEEIWPSALPYEFGKRNQFGIPITGKK